MTTELSPAMRRFLAVGLLLVLVALVWSLVAAPLLDARSEAQRTIDRLQPLLERGRAAVSGTAALQAELTQLKERRNSAGGLLDGSNESIAAVQLQERLKSAVDHVNGDMRSTQVLPARDDGGFRRMTVRAQLSMNLAALQHVIYELEASLPYLFLDNVEITEHSANRRVKQADDDPLLDVQLDLFGYMRKST
jgi:general secretion pathway protein M